MNRIRFALLALLACASFGAAAADRREDRPAAGFSAISMAASLDLDVIQDGTESLMVEGDAQVLDALETFVKDGTLNFMYKRGTTSGSPKRVHAVVHARNMEALALSATGTIHSPSLESDSLVVSISGFGDVDIGRLAARKAQLSISGSGSMNVAGRADELGVRISGSGDLKAAKLESQRAQVAISGSGDATVWARRELAASISGAGSVRYYGDPNIAKSVHGVGHVERVAANP